MNKNMKFEDAMNKLEDLVSDLESGNVSLEESVKLYEQALELAAFCNTKLEMAENKIKILVKDESGSITDMPFLPDNEN